MRAVGDLVVSLSLIISFLIQLLFTLTKDEMRHHSFEFVESHCQTLSCDGKLIMSHISRVVAEPIHPTLHGVM